MDSDAFLAPLTPKKLVSTSKKLAPLKAVKHAKQWRCPECQHIVKLQTSTYNGLPNYVDIPRHWRKFHKDIYVQTMVSNRSVGHRISGLGLRKLEKVGSFEKAKLKDITKFDFFCMDCKQGIKRLPASQKLRRKVLRLRH